MSVTTIDQQRFEAAAISVAAKLTSFREGLSPEEDAVLGAALRAAGADEATDDVAGHAIFIREMIGKIYAALYVNSLPIWGSLEQMSSGTTSSVDLNSGFDGSPVYVPE